MSHYLQAYVGKRAEIQKLVNKFGIETSTITLAPDFVMLPAVEETYRINREDLPEATFGYIETDYFGGFGSQSGTLWVNGELKYHVFEEHYETSPIDHVLKELGIERAEGMDEFDTVGLGKYRCMREFEVSNG